jgi:hypothetical protein
VWASGTQQGSDGSHGAVRKGQKVEIAFVTEAGKKWIKRIAAETPAGGDRRDEPRREHGQAAELRELVRKLQSRLAQLERQVVELRQENAALRRRLRQGGASEGEGVKRDRDVALERSGAFPEGLRGFRGMMVGTIKSKEPRALSVTVLQAKKIRPQSKAKRPESAVGRVLSIQFRPDSRVGQRHIETYRKLKPGDRILFEAFHVEGDCLTLVEELRKTD